MKALEDLKQFYARGNSMVRKLIVINTLVFLLSNFAALVLWLISGTAGFVAVLETFTAFFSVPSSLSALVVRFWTPITYAFVHSGFFHLFFNMLFLYWLGAIFQEFLGNRKTLNVYIGGSIFGAALYILAYNLLPALSSQVEQSTLVGASAGVLALVVGVGTFLPTYEVAFFRFYIPMRWVAVAIVVIDLLSIPYGNAGGHIAHLGGALFGFIYASNLRRQSKFNDVVESIGNFFSRIFKKKKKPLRPLPTVKKKETPVYSTSTLDDFDTDDEPSAEAIDAILDKINQTGYDSLSRQERDLLYKASKQH
jgi:membrane associated rhomboid family serine protease